MKYTYCLLFSISIITLLGCDKQMSEEQKKYNALVERSKKIEEMYPGYESAGLHCINLYNIQEKVRKNREENGLDTSLYQDSRKVFFDECMTNKGYGAALDFKD